VFLLRWLFSPLLKIGALFSLFFLYCSCRLAFWSFLGVLFSLWFFLRLFFGVLAFGPVCATKNDPSLLRYFILFWFLLCVLFSPRNVWSSLAIPHPSSPPLGPSI